MKTRYLPQSGLMLFYIYEGGQELDAPRYKELENYPLPNKIFTNLFVRSRLEAMKIKKAKHIKHK